MKIGQIPEITGVYNKQGINKVERAKEVQGKKDVVSISGSGQDFNAVMKALKDVPDIRNEKVVELSKQIENGSYDVSGKEIIEKMVNNIVDKKV